MKSLHAITLLVAVGAAALSLYALSIRSRQPEVASASEPKALIVRILQRPRWDGTHAFFTKHRDELVSNIEVANFLENKGICIAFVRTAGGNKKFQLCQWMRKTETGWEEVPYLSPHLAGNPFLANWIEGNKGWLQEMDSKKEEWEKDSESVW
jgi:hypothetical protein